MSKTDEMPVQVFTNESQMRRPLTLIRNMFIDLLKSRELAWRLAVRDISAQYRQAALGIIWAFILPLINTVTWIFLNGTGIITVSETALPYPVYVFTGTMLWSIFVDAINAPLKHATSAKSMLAKINFPREALVLSGIYETLFNGAIKVILLLVTLFILGIYPNSNIFLFPFAVLSLVLAGTALGLLLTPVGLLYTDIGKSIPLLMQFFMYITPVVFAIPETGFAATLFRINPITPLIMTARDWLTGLNPEFITYYLVVNLFMFLLLFVVWLIFRVAIPILIERMNA